MSGDLDRDPGTKGQSTPTGQVRLVTVGCRKDGNGDPVELGVACVRLLDVYVCGISVWGVCVRECVVCECKCVSGMCMGDISVWGVRECEYECVWGVSVCVVCVSVRVGYVWVVSACRVSESVWVSVCGV